MMGTTPDLEPVRVTLRALPGADLGVAGGVRVTLEQRRAVDFSFWMVRFSFTLKCWR